MLICYTPKLDQRHRKERPEHPMARIYPERIPDYVRRDTRRSSECSTYECLADALPNDYSVFGWVSWLSRSPAAGAFDGEADFVVAHPDRGILILEVKGGAIERVGATGDWFSVDHTGERHAIKNPFKQAADNRHRLRRKLEELNVWHGAWPLMGDAVAFPDVGSVSGGLGLDAPAEIILFSNDLPRMDVRIPRLFDYWGGHEHHGAGPGREGVERLRALLARSFHLPEVLGAAIRRDSRAILELTSEQYAALDLFSRQRRVLATGGPGTGKTVLAIEKARRLAADEGFVTLLTCFNQLLAKHLRRATEGVPNLTVRSFHELCFEWCNRAGVPLAQPVGAPPRDFYPKHVPERFVDALGELEDRFDAIVVDEGQDFGDDARTAIMCALADRNDSVLYVFQDDAQAVYRDASPWPENGFVPCTLSRNMRNTRAIHETLRVLGAESLKDAGGPDGRTPELIVANDTAAERKELSRALHRLIHEGTVEPRQVAVLVASRAMVDALAPEGKIGAYMIARDEAGANNCVLMESITRFKGLERDVIVLAGLEEPDYCHFRPLLCVGASRARAHLVVIGRAEVVQRFRTAAADGVEA